MENLLGISGKINKEEVTTGVTKEEYLIREEKCIKESRIQ